MMIQMTTNDDQDDKLPDFHCGMEHTTPLGHCYNVLIVVRTTVRQTLKD